MPANATIIGRVAVKVLPDTDNFRRDAQAKLDAIEKKLKIQVPTTIDMTGASRELLEEIRKTNARNRVQDSHKIRLYTTISTNGIREELSKAVRRYNTLAETEKVKLRSDLVADNLKLELDDESLREVKRKIDHWRRQNDPVKLNVKLDWGAVSAHVVSARLQVLTRPRKVDILPVVNNAAFTKAMTMLAALSGARVLDEMFGKLKDFFKDLDKSIPLIGTLALAISGLAGWSLAAASNLFALSMSLAQIGPSVLALPGIFGGIAIGVGTMVVALKDFNNVFPDVKQKLSDLQDTISENFWAKAEAPMRRMIDHLLPQFVAGFAQAATSLGTYFGALSDALRTSFDGELKGMFQGLSDSIKVASTGTAALADLITTLGKTGAGYLPKLAQWFVDITKNFDTFIDKAAGDGRLTGWIDLAVNQIHELGRVASNLGGILAGIARAADAAGGSSLKMFADTLEHIHKTVDSPEFQHGLIDVLNAAHQAMTNIAKQSGPAVKELFSQLGKTLTTVLPIAGDAIGHLVDGVAKALGSPEVQRGLVHLFAGLRDGLAALSPAIAGLGPAVGALLNLIATAVRQLGPLLGTALSLVSGVIAKIAPALEPVIVVLSNGLQSVLLALTPAILKVADAVAKFIAPLANGLAPIIDALVPVVGQLADVLGNSLAQILPVLGQALADIMPSLVPLIKAFTKLALDVIVPLMPMLTKMVIQILPPLAKAIVAVAQAVTPLIEALAKITEAGNKYMIPMFQFLVDVLTGAVVGALNGVTNIFKGAVETIKGIWDTFAGLFSGDWGRMWDGIKETFKGVWDFCLGIVEVVWNVTILKGFKIGFDAIKGLFKDGTGFLRGTWESAWNAIRDVATSVWNTIKAGFSMFLKSLKDAPGEALGILKATFQEAWSTISSACSSAWTAIKNAVVNGIRDVGSFFAGLPGKILYALGDLGGVLYNAGRQILQGFIDGLESMWNSVKDFFGRLTSKLTSWKGPPERDSVLLFDAGVLVIQGFIDGLESKYDSVRKSLGKLTSEIDGMTITPSMSVAAQLNGISAGAAVTAARVEQRTFNYYAAPGGASLSSEEELFAASQRSRFAW